MHYIAKTIDTSTIHFFTHAYSSPQFITSLAPHRSYGLKIRVSCLARTLKLLHTFHSYPPPTSHHSARTPHIPPTFTTSHMQHVSHTNKTQPHHTPSSELQTLPETTQTTFHPCQTTSQPPFPTNTTLPHPHNNPFTHASLWCWKTPVCNCTLQYIHCNQRI